MRNFATQCYSAYSTYYGTAKPKVWAKSAAKLGHRALAITDRNTMAGSLQLEEACREAGIKPIIGYDFSLFEDNSKSEDNRLIGHVLIYIIDKRGWYNMIALNNKSGKPLADGGCMYYRNRLPIDVLLQHTDGLAICIPEAGGGHLFESLTKPKSKMYQIVKQLQGVFKERFFVGVQELTPELEETDFALIPAQDVRVLQRKDLDACKALLDLDDGHSKANIVNGHAPTALEQINDDVPERLLNGLDKLFDLVQEKFVSIKDYKMPVIKDPDPRGTLLKAAVEGFREKLYPELRADITFDELVSPEFAAELSQHYSHSLLKSNHKNAKRNALADYASRLKEEVEVIDEIEKQEYFYPLWQGIKHVESLGLDIGPGRGSGAGSLYNDMLGITKIDPIAEDLLFSRFINVSRRLDPPDIDTDFSTEGRDAAIAFWKKEYGEDCVCKIGTYGRLKIKSAIQAIAKSKGYGIKDNDGNIVQYEPHVLTKILKVRGVTATSRGQDELDEMLQNETFAKFFYKHERWFITYVMPILESVVSSSIHAAGVVITDRPFEEVLPLTFRDKKEGVVTQLEMDGIDLAGYLKYDMLVVEAINVIADVRKMIKKRLGVDLPNIDEIDLSDPQMIRVFNEVFTRGIFQFNTWSQMNYLFRLRPKTFDDLIAAVALIRPGPMGVDAHLEYADRANGLSPVTFRFEETREILGPTFGMLVYQEQMMLLVQKIASFTGVEAEGVRKACGKKKIEEMLKWEEKFMTQGKANGHKQSDLSELWNEIVSFAAYSFNKCIVGSTVVVPRVGTKITVSGLYRRFISGKETFILAVDSDGKTKYRKVKSVTETPARAVYEVATETGYRIVGTDNHRLLTNSGYKMICELTINDQLAVVTKSARKTPALGGQISYSNISKIFKRPSEQVTYDIEMEDCGDEPNFIANGIVSHNSHACAYSLISAYQAYIKSRYLTDYWCSTLMHANPQNKTGNSTYDLKAEAEREGITFIFPRADGFAAEFTVADENKIYWPLGVVKGIGDSVMDMLTDNGHRFHFESMEHFVEVSLTKSDKGRQVITSGVVEALVKVGFFNCWCKPWDAMDEYQKLVEIVKEKEYQAKLEDFNVLMNDYKLKTAAKIDCEKPKRPTRPTKSKGRSYEMQRTDQIYWVTLMNQAYGCQVASWKKLVPFSPECAIYYQEDLTNLRDGASILIGGEVVDILMKSTKKGDSYATIHIVDGAEDYWVKAWSSWWQDVQLDKQRTRPRVGDVIEISVNKGTFNNRPDLSIGQRGAYCRIVARPSQEA